MYFLGEGVQQDRPEARRWIKLSADEGDPNGLFLYGFGFGLTDDETMTESEDGADARRMSESFHWVKRAAEAGQTTAQVMLGSMYFTCRTSSDCIDSLGTEVFELIVPKDQADAEHLFRLAAESGNADGLTFLGDIYLSGGGASRRT